MDGEGDREARSKGSAAEVAALVEAEVEAGLEAVAAWLPN